MKQALNMSFIFACITGITCIISTVRLNDNAWDSTIYSLTCTSHTAQS